MFQVDDQVVHPLHGAGTITDIVERTIDMQSALYYALKLVMDDVVLYVPVDTSDKIGIRPVCTREQAEEFLSQLGGVTLEAEKGWNQRYRDNMEHIRSGKLLEVAQVVKGLSLREQRHDLSAGEKKMLLSARRILESELSFALGQTAKAVAQRIDKGLGLSGLSE